VSSGKKYRAKFFDVNGNYITDLPVAMNGFRKIINGGLGDLTLQVPLRFEEAYQNPALVLMNRVEIYVDNLLLYSGFVAGVTPKIAGTENSVSINCRGHASRFATLPLKNSTTVKLYTDTTTGLKTAAAASSATLDKVLTAIIDRYNAEAVHPIINYATGTIAVSSNAWTYILQTKTIQYAIDKTMENAPADWYWRVGADNIFRFTQRNSTADVYLNFKTQITSLEDPQLIDGMINRRYFAYNGSPPADAKVISDLTSSDAYGDWWDFHTDGRYTDATQVIAVNQALIDAKKNPVRRTVIEVPDSNYDKTTGYDIELLEPGQTVIITNMPEATADVLPDLFTIVAIDYSPSYAKLELETHTDDLAREFAHKEAQDQAVELDDSPATYLLSITTNINKAQAVNVSESVNISIV
jgi:hypothetical protein